MLSGDIPPNQTIYLRNLNEKLKKEGNHTSPFPPPPRAADIWIPPKTLGSPIWDIARCGVFPG